MFTKFDEAYMETAITWSKLSSATRKQVGAIIVKDRCIIAEGYNGTCSGMDNRCEDENNQTLWHVLHAEANALTKVMRSGNTTVGATLYTTLSPCKECSKLIYQSGVNRVIYLNEYKDLTGVEFLKSLGVECLKYE